MRLHASRFRRQAGVSLLELLVVVATIGIIAAIAEPNARSALRKARHGAAYKNMKVLEGGIQAYMIDNNGPPDTISTTTLEPLVTGRYVAPQQRTAILSAIDSNRLWWYYGVSGSWWYDYDYGICFRPKKDGPNVWCYLWPEGIWRWEDNEWTQVM